MRCYVFSCKLPMQAIRKVQATWGSLKSPSFERTKLDSLVCVRCYARGGRTKCGFGCFACGFLCNLAETGMLHHSLRYALNIGLVPKQGMAVHVCSERVTDLEPDNHRFICDVLKLAYCIRLGFVVSGSDTANRLECWPLMC